MVEGLSNRIRIEADSIYYSERLHFGQVDLAVFHNIADEVESLESEVKQLKDDEMRWKLRFNMSVGEQMKALYERAESAESRIAEMKKLLETL